MPFYKKRAKMSKFFQLSRFILFSLDSQGDFIHL